MQALKQRWQSGCLGKALIVGVVLFACVVCGIIGTAVNGPGAREKLGTPTVIIAQATIQKVAMATPGPTVALAPTNTPMPTDIPVPPTNTPEPQAALQAAVAAALGKGNRDVPRIKDVYLDTAEKTIAVSWAINDNAFSSYIGRGGRQDVIAILKAVKVSGAPFDKVNLFGSFAMVDKYGNASESPVVKLIYSKATVDKLNLDNILLTDTIYEAADNAAIHPEFQGK